MWLWRRAAVLSLLAIQRTGSALSSGHSREELRQPPFRPLRSRPQDPFAVERYLLKKEYDYVIGSDEAGTGAIAGPIVVASCCCCPVVDPTVHINDDNLVGVDDCKRLDDATRQRIYQHIVSNPQRFQYSIAVRSNTQLQERVDTATTTDVIRASTLDAMYETITNVANQLHRSSSDTLIYSIVDGHKSPRDLQFPSRPWKQADETVYSVALASIVARVTRDRIMKEYAIGYPDYDFNKNGGYASQQHLEALHRFGPSPIHWHFCKPVKRAMQQESPVPAEHTRLAPKTMSRQTFLLTAAAATSALTTRPHYVSAMSFDAQRGVALPDVGEVAAAVPTSWDGIDDPLPGGSDTKSLMSRLDSSNDTIFYSEPRFVEHVDDQAVNLMTDYISNVALRRSSEQQQAVLDLCSSWTSHIAPTVAKSQTRIVGLGMNDKELRANPALTEWTTQDLNDRPVLPYKDDLFDVVLLQLSIDYLTRPMEVCQEIYRVLKPGGSVHIIFSNRLFLQKAVAIWTGADDVDHVFTVASYLHFCGGQFQDIRAQDLSVHKGREQKISGDPLYVVTATKG